jgi:hypothetical protein
MFTHLYSSKLTELSKKLGQVRLERSPENWARVAMKERKESFCSAGTSAEAFSSSMLLMVNLESVACKPNAEG